MKYTYIPKGVCSRQINLEINNGIIDSCEFVGGCAGNTQGICALVKGMDAEEAVKRLKVLTAEAEVLLVLTSFLMLLKRHLSLNKLKADL